MEKTINELNVEMASIIAEEIKNNNYSFEVRNRTYHNGYIDISLTIGGEKADVSVSRKGFICWHGFISDEVSRMLRKCYDYEDKIADEVFKSVMEEYFVEKGGDNE